MQHNQNYLRFITDVEALLEEEGKKSPENSWSAGKIISKIKESKSYNFSDGTMSSYISVAANRDKTRSIASSGSGYFVADKTSELVKILEKEIEPEDGLKKERLKREHKLYTSVVEWLKVDGYNAADISNGKSGGVWGNPDVLGLKVAVNYGLRDFEIVTVEVKTSYSNWEQYIFEAISHKRFANCSYFAYATYLGDHKIPEEMYRYCEMYRVGLLQIILTESEFKQLHSSTSKADFEKFLPSGTVEEKIPAPYDFVSPRYQIEFFQSIKIGDEAALMRWPAGK
jgi:hypothetical protein